MNRQKNFSIKGLPKIKSNITRFFFLWNKLNDLSKNKTKHTRSLIIIIIIIIINKKKKKKQSVTVHANPE